MSQVSGFGLRVSAVVLALLMCCTAVYADSKDTNLRPLGNEPSATTGEPGRADEPATSAALETKYRAELETRLAQERTSYEASLKSLWFANIAVWGCLLAFIVMQGLSAKKRSAELARLKAQRE